MHDIVLLSAISVALFLLPTIISVLGRIRTSKVDRIREKSFEMDRWSFDDPKSNKVSDHWVLD